MKTVMRLTGEASLGVLKNPFAAQKLDRIFLQYTKALFSDKWAWSANVYFKNGQTSGEQKFENDDFEVMIRQINEFIASLGE